MFSFNNREKMVLYKIRNYIKMGIGIREAGGTITHLPPIISQNTS